LREKASECHGGRPSGARTAPGLLDPVFESVATLAAKEPEGTKVVPDPPISMG